MFYLLYLLLLIPAGVVAAVLISHKNSKPSEAGFVDTRGLISDSVTEAYKLQIAQAELLGLSKRQVKDLERMMREYEQSIANFKRSYAQQTQAAEQYARTQRIEAERLRRQAEMRPRVVMPPPHDPPTPANRKVQPPPPVTPPAAEAPRVVITKPAPKPSGAAPVIDDYEEHEPIDVIIHRRSPTRKLWPIGRSKKERRDEGRAQVYINPEDPDNKTLAEALDWAESDRCSQPGCLEKLVNGRCPKHHIDNWQSK